MKGKNKFVFSPHHICARNNKVSLIPIKSFQVTNKIVGRRLQKSGRKKNVIIPNHIRIRKQKLSLFHFMSIKRTTEFVINTIVKLKVT